MWYSPRYHLSAVLTALIGLVAAWHSACRAENMVCDPAVDTSVYYCRGWQDGVGKDGHCVRFIARIVGDQPNDDLGQKVVPLGDINGDERGDFMVWIKNACEWRVYYGDTLIAKEPSLIWPRCSPAFAGNFALGGDVSGDGQPDLFRFAPALKKEFQIYFAGAAFDTFPDLVVADSAFVFIGMGGDAVSSGGDLNGDGQPDLAVGDPSWLQESPKQFGRVYVYWGGSALDSIPDLIFTDTFWVGQNQPRAVGDAVAIMPSLNSDSYADLVLGRGSMDLVTKNPPGRVHVYFGGPAMDTVRDLHFISPDTAYDPGCWYLPTTYFGIFTEPVGDANLDGFEDLLVSGYGCVPSYIYYGGPSFDSVVDLRLTQPLPGGEGMGHAMTALGDVNGDGHPDFCTVYMGNEALAGWVFVHYARSNPTGIVDWVIDGDDWFMLNDDVGRTVTSVGDVDGDGYDDIAVGARSSQVDEENRGVVYIFAGYDPDANTGIFDDEEPPVPSSYQLIESIAPNPFNASTTIRLSPAFRDGTVTIYDILGRVVRRFAVAGEGVSQNLIWDGRDEAGASLAAGVYFARAVTAQSSETHKLVLLK